MHRSGAHEWMHRLQPALEAALGKIMMLPERKLDSITAFRLRFLEVKRVMIDGTERKARLDAKDSSRHLRPIQRPKDSKQQTLNYSGNAFAGVKGYNAVSVYRNRIEGFDDHLMLTAAGLWNFYLIAA